MSELEWLALVIAAFAGGAFGAAIGPLAAFTVTGVLVVLGEAVEVTRRTIAPEAEALAVTESLAFGVAFGPHVSFAGGAAAVAYAAKKGYVLDDGFAYHPAKRITRGLGGRPDVLAVGGAFGILGHAVATGAIAVDAPWDPVAGGVVLSALAHRAILGYDLVGRVRTDGGWFSMSGAADPAAPDADPVATDGGVDGARPPVEPWLPYLYRVPDVTIVGAVAGVLGAYIAYVTASPFLAFGVSAAVLGFLVADVAAVPVTHHMTLPASTAALALVGESRASLTPALVADAVALPPALLVGAVFGILGALAGELAQRIFYAHGDTHVDPPAVSIVVTTALIAALALLGVFETAVWIPHP